MRSRQITIKKLIEILSEFDENTPVSINEGDRYGDRLVIRRLGSESEERRRKSQTYAVWGAMHQRCKNPNNSSFRRYGGRGITVCERWNKFENFILDMGVRPPGMSIERINNDGNYEPNNCKWATREEQQNNRAISRLFLWEGRTYSIAQLSRKYGMSYQALRDRIESGWPLEKALLQPVVHSSIRQIQKFESAEINA